MGFYIRFWFKGKRYGFISKITLGNSRKNTRGENLNSNCDLPHNSTICGTDHQTSAQSELSLWAIQRILEALLDLRVVKKEAQICQRYTV